jgi:hypothetical protein
VKRLLPLAVTAALALGLVFGGCSLFESWFGTDEDEEGSGLIKAAAPVADPPPGYVLAGTSVHFTSATEGARVYVSSSTGIPPALDSKGDALITRDITILAFARAPEGYEDSDEVSFEYKVNARDKAVINLSFPPIDAVTSKVWDYAGGVYTIHDGADVTVSGSTTDRIVVQGTATVTLDGASIVLSGDDDASPLDLANGANLTLRLAGTNTLTASGGAAGVHVPEGRTLTITSAAGDGSESGTLTATGGGTGSAGAGIGGGMSEPGGTITIAGGTVNAQGGGYTGDWSGAAGIGGGGDWDSTGVQGGHGDAGTITITGGVVNATGGSDGAGIGSGGRAPNTTGRVTISGGTVNATGGYFGAGIGSGANGGGGGTGGDISITGGEVTAQGGVGGTGIGGGNGCSGGTIKITGGSGTATSGSDGTPAIGPCYNASGGSFNGVEGGWPEGGTYTWGN